MSSAPDARVRIPAAVFAVVGAGVSAALHLGKLPPAMAALQQELGLSLVEAGFMLSLVQVASMSLGLLVGLAADTIGLRRSMLMGVLIVSVASLLGGWLGRSGATDIVAWLLVLRGIEGIGFLLAVMPGPGLIRALAPPGADKAALGLWGAYMPFGVAMALLCGPAVIAATGWTGWWWALSLVSLAAALALWRTVPADASRPSQTHAAAEADTRGRLRRTVTAGGPWLVALAFAVYSSQWMAVIGFLPVIYADAGVQLAWSAVLTATAAGMNIIGNLLGGRWLQRGVRPDHLLRAGFAVMALGSFAAFAQWGQGADAIVLPASLRYVAVCLFSMAGGLVPSTLFMLAVRLAPSPATVSTTVGLMQQASSFGQFLAPPLVAWVAGRVGGWQWTWVVTLVCCIAGLALAARVPAQQRARYNP